jgi:DNA-binding NtrC family response regulator
VPWLNRTWKSSRHRIPKTVSIWFHSRHPQIVLTDLIMPKMSGMEVLDRIMEFDPATEVILMTAHYSTESAVEAIKKGAADYLNKPVSIAALREKIGGVVEIARTRQQASRLEDELLASAAFEGMVGNSPTMWICSRAFAELLRTTAPFWLPAKPALARIWWRRRCTG